MTASSNGSLLSAVSGVLTDSGSNTFQFGVPTFGGNYTVVRNGTALAYSGADMLVANGTIYLVIASGAWYVNSGTSFTAVSASTNGNSATSATAPLCTNNYLSSFGAASGSDYVLLLNGAPYTGNFAASEVYYADASGTGMILAKNNAGSWFYLDINFTWHPANDPTTATADGTQLTSEAGTITDSSGNVWYFIPGNDIYLNGAGVSGTSSASVVLISGGSIYYQDTSGNWHKYVSGSFTSSSNPLVTTLPAFITPGTGSFSLNSVTYTITAGGDMQGNSSTLNGGTGTSMGALLGNQVYGQDSSTKDWYLWNGTSFVIQPVTPSGTKVTTAGGFLILTNGNIATLDLTTNKVAFNGTDDSSTSNVEMIEVYSGALYYENTSSAFYVNYNLQSGSANWSSATNPATNVPVFADEFQAASLNIGQDMNTSYTWSYASWYSPNWNGYAPPGGSGFFVNPDYASTPITGLYSVDGTDNAILELFATPGTYSAACDSQPYVQAQMVASNFERVYGYWEVRCKISSVEGTNTAALWLMSHGTNGYYQEIDVIEANNQTGQATAFQTIHYANSSGAESGQDQAATYYGTSVGGTPYDATSYNIYAVNWQPDYTTFYLNGVQTLKVPTPSYYTDPMFPVVSLQAGASGGWTPAIPGGATLPQQVYIDYIRCYPTMP